MASPKQFAIVTISLHGANPPTNGSYRTQYGLYQTPWVTLDAFEFVSLFDMMRYALPYRERVELLQKSVVGGHASPDGILVSRNPQKRDQHANANG